MKILGPSAIVNVSKLFKSKKIIVIIINLHHNELVKSISIRMPDRTINSLLMRLNHERI